MTIQVPNSFSGARARFRRWVNAAEDVSSSNVFHLSLALERTNIAGRLEGGHVQERLKAALGDRAEGLLRRIKAESVTFRFRVE